MPYPTKEAILGGLGKLTATIGSAQDRFTDDEALQDHGIDPMMPLLHIGTGNVADVSEWLKLERQRRVDKAISNQVGLFHQEILASLPGWSIPDAVYDLVNEDRKIIVEVKNKHNTLNAGGAEKTYENLSNYLKIHPDATAYLVTIIPKRGRMNRPFTIKGKAVNERLRVVDGATFYDLATGEKDALEVVYQTIVEALEGNRELKNYVESAFFRIYTKAIF